MSTSEVKNKLIEKIQNTNDSNLLKEALRLLEVSIDDLEEPYILSEHQTLAVEEAREQIKRGEYLNHEEANEKIKKWLEE